MDKITLESQKSKSKKIDIASIIKDEEKYMNNIKNRFGIEVQEKNKTPKVILDFLNYLETIKGKSENTIEAYKIDICLLFKYLKVYKGYYIPDDIEFEEIPIDDLGSDFVRGIVLTDSILSYHLQRNKEIMVIMREQEKLLVLSRFLNICKKKLGL